MFATPLRIALLVAGCWLSIVSSSNSLAQQNRKPAPSAPANPVEAAAIEFALSEAEIQDLVGRKANLLLTTGATRENVEIKSFSLGRQKDRVKMILFTEEDDEKVKRFPAQQVYWIEIGDKQYRVNYLPSLKAGAIQDVEKRNAAIAERIEAAGGRMWEPISAEDQANFVQEEKEFLLKVKEYFSNLPLQFHETKYFLFFTDLPAAQVAPIVLKLDKMYETLGDAFGFPPGHNIWRGKCTVVAFVNQTPFLAFEQQFMSHTPDRDVQGLCHGLRSGRVVISCFRGDDLDYFVGVLVHETAHGYVRRYLSDIEVPSWVNEGLADWVAGAVVPQAAEIGRRKQRAAGILRQSGTFGGAFFSAQGLESWQYGAANSMIDLLVRQNPEQFKLFFNGMKEGLSWEDSLKRAYGINGVELSVLYGRTLGIPQLAP